MESSLLEHFLQSYAIMRLKLILASWKDPGWNKLRIYRVLLLLLFPVFSPSILVADYSGNVVYDLFNFSIANDVPELKMLDKWLFADLFQLGNNLLIINDKSTSDKNMNYFRSDTTGYIHLGHDAANILTNWWCAVLAYCCCAVNWNLSSDVMISWNAVLSAASGAILSCTVAQVVLNLLPNPCALLSTILDNWFCKALELIIHSSLCSQSLF